MTVLYSIVSMTFEGIFIQFTPKSFLILLPFSKTFLDTQNWMSATDFSVRAICEFQNHRISMPWTCWQWWRCLVLLPFWSCIQPNCFPLARERLELASYCASADCWPWFSDGWCTSRWHFCETMSLNVFLLILHSGKRLKRECRISYHMSFVFLENLLWKKWNIWKIL